MKFQSVLIVTYGRSGSTLLQGILNSIPGCLVRGENYNLCEGLFLSYKAYLRTQHEQGSKASSSSSSSPWYGARHLDARQYLADMRAMVLSHLKRGVPAGTKLECVGFKEIRYLSMDMHGEPGSHADKLRSYLDFLSRLLPNPGIVFLKREHAQVLRSGWWNTRSPETVLEKLTEFESIAEDYVRTHDHCHFIDYADMVANGRALESLFDFLGAPYDRARVAEVLEQRHSYGITTIQPAAERAKSLVVKVHDKPASVAAVRLDPQPSKIGAQRRKLQFGGVVVVPGAGQRELVLRDGQGNALPVTWGLPSPAIGKELSDIVQAQTARFRCEDVPLVETTYQLMLRDRHTGQEQLLASLLIQPGEPVATDEPSRPSPAHAPAAATAVAAAPAVVTPVQTARAAAQGPLPVAPAAGKRIRPFIIWTLQRTGGTHLAQSLFNHTPSNGLHEPFNGDREFGDVHKRWERMHDQAALEAALNDICAKGVQFKHCVEVVSPHLNAALARISQQRGYQHVFLFRRRSADRLLSLHFAETTGVWGKKAARDKTDIDQALSSPLPVEKLVSHQRRCDAELTRLYRELLALGAKPMLVAFEDIYMASGEEPRQRIDQLLDGLGIEPPDRDQFAHNVLTGGDQGTRGNYDLFPRRDELEQKCKLLPGFAPEQTADAEA